MSSSRQGVQVLVGHHIVGVMLVDASQSSRTILDVLDGAGVSGAKESSNGSKSLHGDLMI